MFQQASSTVLDVRDRVLLFLRQACTPFYTTPVSLAERWANSTIIGNFVISAIIDGTEQKCHNSRNGTTNAAFFSAKKSQHSVNILIMCSPQLQVYYVSPSYPGRNVDMTITNQVLQNWTANWEDEELIVADQGFICKNPRIVIPCDYADPFAKQLRTVRCRVENCIANFKHFAVCREPLREKVNHADGWNRILSSHQAHWQIVAGIVNCNLQGNFK